MTSAKKLFTSARILILVAALLLSALAIHPSFDKEGVAIRGVVKNSSAAIAGIESPDANVQPMNREVVKSINNILINSVADYSDATKNLEVGQQLILRTDRKVYVLEVKPLYKTTVLNQTQLVNKTIYNETLNATVNVTVEEPVVEHEVIGVEDVGLTVYPKPVNNIRRGLDLEGGTRVLLEPQEEVDDQTLDLVISNIKQRLNVYGVSDIIVRPTKDFAGNTYIAVEIAGVNKDEVRELLAKQGKFEAKIGTDSVFLGGDDIAYVCRSPSCSGIDPQRGCGQISNEEWACGFSFTITLSPQAAGRQAAATSVLDVLVDESGEGYLSENLTLYLDDQVVDELRIASELKGSATTQIRITGSGAGITVRDAEIDAIANMKKLQTVLITGSLPVKLDIVKTDAVSPVLGQTFIKNVMLIGLLAMLAVIVVVFARYRSIKVALPMVITMVSEVIILLGIASLIGWRLDLAAIAGIIIAVGTGVDDQIVIADETMSSRRKEQLGWKERMSRAFFIIMAAYFATVVAMLPLWFAGAGLLKGFALTTILGVSIGVFITRPAYAKIVEYFLKD